MAARGVEGKAGLKRNGLQQILVASKKIAQDALSRAVICH